MGLEVLGSADPQGEHDSNKVDDFGSLEALKKRYGGFACKHLCAVERTLSIKDVDAHRRGESLGPVMTHALEALTWVALDRASDGSMEITQIPHNQEGASSLANHIPPQKYRLVS